MGSTAPLSGKSAVPVYEPEQDAHRKRIAEWAKEVMRGKLANVAVVTLTAGTTTTSVTDERVGIQSFIGFMPTTANAASAAALGSMYVSSRDAGSFIITHNNSASVDKTFTYCVLG